MEPTASGVLAKTPLAHLVLYCLEKRLRGTLVLRPRASDDPQAADYITLVDGMPAKIRVADPVEHLGRICVELGIIDDATYNESLMKLAGGGLHGQILLASGKIDAAALERGLRAQLARKLGHLFSRPQTTSYEYYDGVDLLGRYGGPEQFPIEPLPIVWAGIRSNPSAVHLDAAVERVVDAPLRLKPAASLDRLDFSRAEREVIARISASPSSPNELIRSGLDARTVRLVVYAMLLLKQIEPAPRVAPKSQAQPRSEAPAAGGDTADLIASLTASLQAAPEPELGARELILSSTPPPAGSSASSPELAARRSEIVERAAVIGKLTYFQVLGLAEGASPDEAKGAYFQLVKRWHPDRLPPELADVRDEVGRVFALIAEAYQTLTDADRRARYVQLLKDGGGTKEDQQAVQRALEAAGAFQKADFFIHKGNFAEAEPLAERAYELDPTEPDQVAVWAWVQANKPERREVGRYDDLLKVVDQALADAPRNERVRYVRGMILKAAGRLGDAMRDFREIAEANPRHVDAVREVRLYTMRHDRERRTKDEGTGSLLGRFMKKK